MSGLDNHSSSLTTGLVYHKMLFLVMICTVVPVLYHEVYIFYIQLHRDFLSTDSVRIELEMYIWRQSVTLWTEQGSPWSKLYTLGLLYVAQDTNGYVFRHNDIYFINVHPVVIVLHVFTFACCILSRF